MTKKQPRSSSPEEDQKRKEPLPEECSVPQDQENTEQVDRVAELEALVAALRDEAGRAKADLYNYRQRVERDKGRLRQSLLEEFVLRLLPIMDNLERALAAGDQGTVKDLRDGVAMVQRQFLQTLTDFGVEPIGTADSIFDPAVHEAVALCEVDDSRDGQVICEILKGYCLEGRVIRPAQVQVGRKAD
ncbi:MAG: nucleotide exchange factor GrpE [Synergistaceae bacterium]|nr:nucleotide exchange factor GrpE [Synergistaceae bacterium]